MNPLRIGGFEVFALNDLAGSAFALSEAFPGVRADAWTPYRSEYPNLFDGPAMRNRVGAFLIRDATQTVLVDAGLGAIPREPGSTSLLAELEQLGVAPGEVNTVFLTHAHPDHVGWTLTEGQATFANARCIISRTEYDWAPERLRGPLEALHALGKLEVFDTDAHLGVGLEVLPLPGHTPGQMGVIVQSGHEAVLIAADALHHPAQVDRPEWHTKFDVDVDQGIETRKRIIRRAETDGLWLAASHFPAAFGRVVKDGSRRSWVTG